MHARRRLRFLPFIYVGALLAAGCGVDKLSPDITATPAAVQPDPCSLLDDGAIAAALAAPPPTPSPSALPSASTSASPAASGSPQAGASPSAAPSAKPSPTATATAAATATSPAAAPRGVRVDGSVKIGTKSISAAQCLFAAADGPLLVVSVLPKTTLAALQSGIADGVPLGPAVVEESSTTSILLVPKDTAVVELALTDSTIDSSTRGNRLAMLADRFIAVSLPTLAPVAAGSTPGARPTLAPAPVVGQVVTGQTAATKVSETDTLKFAPDTVTLKAGDVVEWDNGGQVSHNVTFDDYPDITSDTMGGGATFSVKFTKPGTYSYRCTFHPPGMIGTITVH